MMSLKTIWTQNSQHTTTSTLGGGIAFGAGNIFPVLLGGTSYSSTQTPLVATCSPPVRTYYSWYALIILIVLSFVYFVIGCFILSMMPIYHGIITGIAGTLIGSLILFYAINEVATTTKNADRDYWNQINKWQNTYYCFNCDRFDIDVINLAPIEAAPCIPLKTYILKLGLKISFILVVWYILIVVVSLAKTTPVAQEASVIPPEAATDPVPYMRVWQDTNLHPIGSGTFLRQENKHIVIFNGTTEQLIPINQLCRYYTTVTW